MMKKGTGFTLIELLIVITVIGILAVLVLLFLSSIRQSARDNNRKSIAQEIQKANKAYWDKNNDYASSIGDLTSNCTGAAANTLVGATLLGCPSQQARTGGADARWNAVYTYTDSSHWAVTTDLERGGTFSCDQDGCR